jgi:hypothetical protein
VFLRNPANIKGMAETRCFPKKVNLSQHFDLCRLPAEKGLLTETKVMAQIEM